jgi:hypothetical protein
MGRIRDYLYGSGREELLERDVAPLEGTNISLFNSIIPNWWDQNINGSFLWGSPQLADRVWVANRCQQMNAQQIASMPLEYHGPDGQSAPAWVSSPDPNWFPNGIGDAVHSIVDQLYGWGFVLLYVTNRYADGYPQTWSVLDSSRVTVSAEDGARVYAIGEKKVPLDPSRVVQIDRNPGVALTGSSALRSYAQMAWGLLAAGNQAMTVQQGGIPFMYLKSDRKLDRAQAESLQQQWMERTQTRNGAPPVVPPEITPTVLSINPSDLSLLETQQFNAKAIATAYGVPAVLLNMAIEGRSLTYQNPGALGEMWWRFELRTTATRVANALSAQMLPRGQWVSFNAADTYLALSDISAADDEQQSQNNDQQQSVPPAVAAASPAQQPRSLTAIGGGG